MSENDNRSTNKRRVPEPRRKETEATEAKQTYAHLVHMHIHSRRLDLHARPDPSHRQRALAVLRVVRVAAAERLACVESMAKTRKIGNRRKGGREHRSETRGEENGTGNVSSEMEASEEGAKNDVRREERVGVYWTKRRAGNELAKCAEWGMAHSRRDMFT